MQQQQIQVPTTLDIAFQNIDSILSTVQGDRAAHMALSQSLDMIRAATLPAKPLKMALAPAKDDPELAEEIK